ncbi:MAG: heterodisulfide reductase-related iron-sulfur binding cluster [Chloroflexota bacterium]
MLSPTEKFLFFFLVIVCGVATINTFGKMVKIIGQGQGKLRLDEFPKRVFNAIVAFLSQGRLIRHRRVTSLFHFGVAFGFMFYQLVNVVDVGEGLIENFHVYLDNPIGKGIQFFADIFGTLVLISVTYFLLRRFAFADPALTNNENVKLHPKARAGGIRSDSLVVGVFILIHTGFRLLSAAFFIAQEGHFVPSQPVSSLVASAMSGWSPLALDVGWHVSWWLAVGLIVLFLPYFPYTKHAHLFMGPVNYLTRPERNYLGQMFTMDFEDESLEQFGAANLFDLEQTSLMDAYACIMCNRCQEVCPAYNTGKELSPSAIEINKRYFMNEHIFSLADGSMTEAPLLDHIISESAVWACTACGACVDICPVGNEPMLDIMDMRRNQVLMESNFPEELKGAFVGMERQGNPWSSTESRMAWAEPLPFNVPTTDENPNYEYLLWVGCAGAFNPDSQEIVRSVATILDAAGVSFAVLGEAESCTGDSARRAGNEYLYWEMAQGNIETLNGINAHERRIVTSCPHCFTTIGKEYKELGGDYHVFHHTQLIADLVGKGKLKLNGTKLEHVTYHDPCYLGRHNGIVQEPREALAMAGMTLMEMDKSGTDSFCCGAGGAQMWKEEEHGDEAVNINRYKQAEETGAKTLAVGCPFCAQMMNDASRELGDTMEVKDIAQLVVDAMK